MFDQKQRLTSQLVRAAVPEQSSLTRPRTHTELDRPGLGNQAAQRFAESCPLTLPGPARCPFGGICHSCPAPAQAKLAVSQPGDRYEQEADRVAEQVMRMPEPAVQRACTDCDDAQIQTRPLSGQIGPLIQRQEPVGEEEEEEDVVQAKPAGNQVAPVHAANQFPSLYQGHPLSASSRRFFEPRFGRDFSQVRIHSDPSAAQAARSVNAQAFTYGRDIVFGAGQYAPETAAGQKLIAHELTHVVQQGPRQAIQPTIQRQRQRVTLAHSGQCADPTSIAEAIPGAKSMAWTTVTWFLSFNPRNRARVDELLRVNFRSDSQSVYDAVKDNMVDIYSYLSSAQSGNIEFRCEPSTDPECQNRDGYVMTNERNRVHVCPGFFGGTLEERRWLLIHECAHLAGAHGAPEQYFAYFGTVDCTTPAPQASASAALDNADNYARFIWCLTRRPDVELRPAATP